MQSRGQREKQKDICSRPWDSGRRAGRGKHPCLPASLPPGSRSHQGCFGARCASHPLRMAVWIVNFGKGGPGMVRVKQMVSTILVHYFPCRQQTFYNQESVALWDLG